MPVANHPAQIVNGSLLSAPIVDSRAACLNVCHEASKQGNIWLALAAPAGRPYDPSGSSPFRGGPIPTGNHQAVRDAVALRFCGERTLNVGLMGRRNGGGGWEV
jgi:hypothetical protein